MIDILLQGLDNETRMALLPKEQEIIKEWEDNLLSISPMVALDYIQLNGVLVKRLVH